MSRFVAQASSDSCTNAAPVLKENGTPKRRKGGQIVRDNTSLSDAELTQFIGLDSSKRYNRMRARRVFERLEADGIIETEKTLDGRLRLFGPRR